MDAKLRTTITLLQGLVVFAILALSVTTLEYWDRNPGVAGASDVMAIRDAAPGTSAAALEGHEGACWRLGDEPLVDTLPGHVVSRKGASGAYAYRGSDAAIKAAFEQLVFDGVLAPNEFTKPVDHKLEIAAFCK